MTCLSKMSGKKGFSIRKEKVEELPKSRRVTGVPRLYFGKRSPPQPCEVPWPCWMNDGERKLTKQPDPASCTT